MPWLLCILGLAALARAEEKLHTATFKPGKLGIGANWNTGEVTKVDKDSQGARNGVKVGMVLHQIDGKTYHEPLLDKKVAGKKDFEITFRQRPPPPTTTKPPPKEDDLPPRPDFKYAKELNPKTFKEEVYKVTNGTDSPDASKPPAYYPVVMFHVSWCKHCRHALPEFEKAAKMISDAKDSGQLKDRPVLPKFFVIECDVPAEHKPVCDMYVGSNFPAIEVFRDRRQLHFNRPRVAQTFAWWAMHVTRPPIAEIVSADVLSPSKDRGPIFVLSADMRKDMEVMNAWRNVALDRLEDHTFTYAKPGSEAAKMLPPAPSVSVKGDGLEPLPLQEDMTEESLGRWVNFNQFKPVAEFTPYSERSLKRCGFEVVALVYDGDKPTSRAALDQFKFKAQQLRQDGQFLFAAIDASNDDNQNYLISAFPLLSPKLLPPPRIFVFSGEDVYWESPSLQDPSAITAESLGALLASSEARQDRSNWGGFIKEKRKLVFRYATSSALALVISVSLPLLLFACCWTCVKALLSSDDEPDAAVAKSGKND